MLTIPVLETGRLRLRGHTADDFAASLSMWNAPEVYRYISGQPCSPEAGWSRLLRFAGNWALMGFGYWLVEDRSTGSFIGEVGFGEFHRDLEPSISGTLEAGWVLSPDAHGKGYGYEALTAALDWARHNKPTHDLTALVHPDNSASMALARKAGFSICTETTYHDQPTAILYRANHDQ